jgi:BlaI family transcriptional regulator, penicillinase repressor
MARGPKPLSILTAVELEMMRALWAHGPGTVDEVRQRLQRKLAYTSVLTMLRILEQKGYAQRGANPSGGRGHQYAAAIPEREVRRGHLRDLMDRLFQGKPEALVVGVLEDEQVSRAELEQLRALVDERLGARGGGKK